MSSRFSYFDPCNDPRPSLFFPLRFIIVIHLGIRYPTRYQGFKNYVLSSRAAENPKGCRTRHTDSVEASSRMEENRSATLCARDPGCTSDLLSHPAKGNRPAIIALFFFKTGIFSAATKSREGNAGVHYGNRTLFKKSAHARSKKKIIRDSQCGGA